MRSTTLTIDQIDISPLNVRTYRPDINDTATLRASILAEGLQNPIHVHPMRGHRRQELFGAIAGGRRTRAIKALVKDGALPADYPVKVTIHDEASDAQLIELSITENLIRKDLRAHELWAGVARAAAKGHDVDQIARGLGQADVAGVRQWLRLGQLAAPVFQAFVAGTITEAQASAYAATADQELQAAVFARLGAGDGYQRSPAAIRAAMKIGDVETAKLLRFVGEDAYRAAGGRYELDLFADQAEQRGRVVDEGKLHQLVEAKLEQARAEVRAKAGGQLRFVVDPPKNQYGYTDYTLQITPKGAPAAFELPEGDVVGRIEIGRDGKPEVSFWWASRTAKFGKEKKPPGTAAPRPIDRSAIGDAMASYDARAQADAAVKEDAGLSQDAIQILRAVRRAMLRAALVLDADRHGEVARDYLVWAQLRMLAGADAPGKTGMERLGTEDIGGHDLSQKARAQIEATGVVATVGAALAELSSQSFFTGENEGEAFLDFRAAAPRLKNLAAAIVAGIALQRSLAAPGYERPIHDVVAADTGAGEDAAVREVWRPTAQLLALTPKTPRIGLVEELVDEATRKKWAALKNDEVTDRVLAAATARHDWVHPLLRFNTTLACVREAAE